MTELEKKEWFRIEDIAESKGYIICCAAWMKNAWDLYELGCNEQTHPTLADATLEDIEKFLTK